MRRLLLLSCLFLLAASALAQLKGFELNGDKWTFTQGSWKLQGLLIKPKGEGPFPAILVSHGKGGSAEFFARKKAEEFATWGYVSIAVDYTFAGSGGNPSDDGASAENLKRAMKCLEILRSLRYVDGHRLAAYGNSMGAFLTIALAAKPEANLKAAAITAGGIVPVQGYAAPDASVAKKIKIPFLIIHGEADSVVPPELSFRLKEVLDQNKVRNRRVTYPGEGHNVHNTQAKEVYKQIRQWFGTYVR